MKKGDLVTVTLEENNQAANTYQVFAELGDEVLLCHPLHSKCLIIKRKDELNKVQPTLKDSNQRALEFALNRQEHLDHNAKGELEALSLFFVVNRYLTNSQKKSLANLCGYLASIHFHNDITLAMKFVVENTGVLSPFNLMWYNNFKDMFFGKRQITSPKQRDAIFNIAGSVLAELERNEIAKRPQSL
jgi:hypothetical protein